MDPPPLLLLLLFDPNMTRRHIRESGEGEGAGALHGIVAQSLVMRSRSESVLNLISVSLRHFAAAASRFSALLFRVSAHFDDCKRRCTKLDPVTIVRFCILLSFVSLSASQSLRQRYHDLHDRDDDEKEPLKSFFSRCPCPLSLRDQICEIAVSFAVVAVCCTHAAVAVVCCSPALRNLHPIPFPN
jgi:hypothetical protein